MKTLGIDKIAALLAGSARTFRTAFATHQGRLPKELRWRVSPIWKTADRYLRDVYPPGVQREIRATTAGRSSAFVPFWEESLNDILCEQFKAPSATTIACVLKVLRCKFPATAPAPLCQSQKCACIATRMACWPFYTVPAVGPMMPKGRIGNQKSRTSSNSASRRPRRKRLGLPLCA